MPKNHQKTHQSSLLTPWDPPEVTLEPLDPLDVPLDPLRPLNIPPDLLGPLSSPVLPYKSSEDLSNVSVDPMRP